MRTRAHATIGALLGVVLLAVGCTPPSIAPDGSVPQASPFGVHGMAVDPGVGRGGVWGADLFGGQLVRFDPDTGTIAERYGMQAGLCGTDDVAVMADGALVATCPTTGRVIRVPRGGPAQLLAQVGRSVNPIVADPDGDAVLVGFGTDDNDQLLRVPTDGGPVEVVADGLPVINGFGFGPDGLLYVPTGGAGGLLGTGGLGAIDISTGGFRAIPLTFDEPGKTGFDFAVGVDVGPDGTVYVAQGLDPSVYAVDPRTGHATLVGRTSVPVADNVLALPDGRVILSGFVGGLVTVFTPSAAGWSTRVQRVGS